MFAVHESALSISLVQIGLYNSNLWVGIYACTRMTDEWGLGKYGSSLSIFIVTVLHAERLAAVATISTMVMPENVLSFSLFGRRRQNVHLGLTCFFKCSKVYKYKYQYLNKKMVHECHITLPSFHGCIALGS